MPDPAAIARTAASDATALDEHFEFGVNWRRFLEVVDERRIDAATESLRRLLGRDDLDGVRFLDAGCGSGLFSLAAHLLGADVVGFDFDPQSVACASTLQRRFAVDRAWTIREGSVLDRDFLAAIGRFDIVYSWGVLHHTGAMWDAIDAVADCVDNDGTLAIALYNDQGRTTDRWRGIKSLYRRLPTTLRTPYVAAVGAVYFGGRAFGKAAAALAGPIEVADGRTRSDGLADSLKRSDARGMSRWYDLVDWVGGWPLETATPGEVVAFLGDRGFAIERLLTVGGNHGCNEYVATRRRSRTRDGDRLPADG